MTNVNEFANQFTDTMIQELSANLSSYVLSVIGYILLAVGVYAIAKRRGVANPWLAWIPFGQSWMLGCISDQYQYVTMGKEKSKRKLLLWLEIGVALAAIATIIFLLKGTMGALSLDENAVALLPISGSRMSESQVMTTLIVSVCLGLVMMGISIAFTVLKYMALYDLYRSCDPARATVYTVLSVVLGAVVTSIFVMICREKDFGMPPRRDQTPYGEPVYQLPQQTWQEPQSPEDPWDI